MSEDDLVLADDGVEAEASAAEAPPAEEATKPNPLFADEDAVEDIEDEAEEAAAEEAEPPKQQLSNGLKRRLSQLAAKRKEAVREAEAAKRAEAELRAEIEKAKPLRTVLDRRYAQFKNPEAVLEGDAEFMDILEQHKTNPTIQAAIAFVASKKGGTVAAQPLVEPKQPQADPAVNKLLTKLATQEIETTLAKLDVKPLLRNTLRKEILSGATDLSAVDEKYIIQATRDWIESNGATMEDVLNTAPQAPKRPPTGRGGRPAPRLAPKEDAVRPGEKQTPKTVSEWQSGREERLRALLSAQLS